ncbi:hypothetical protein [Anaerorhabdus sp.]|uniref:hypothetical protein n=1 Tax=Anaerorhabdus sp. TaxID=1872524 RepID=UPI002FCB420C
MTKTLKNLFTLVICSFVLLGCQSKDNESFVANKQEYNFYNAYDSINEDETLVVRSDADISIDPSDPNEIEARSDSIVIATVQSIDGADVINKSNQTKCLPYTYGTLIIESVFKGELTSGSEVKYTRMGGIVSYQQYLSSLKTAQREKLINQPQVGNAQYVDYSFGDDIKIEVGKSYLMYLKNPENTVTDPSAYSIMWWQGGMREVQTGNQELRSATTNEIQVYNNYTNEWESLNTVVQ